MVCRGRESYVFLREIPSEMRLLNWYVTRGFLVAFAMAIGVLTFAMTGANMVKVLDYIAQGIPASVFGKFILYILPIILTFTVPWAVMVAVMLVFGRMSADNEITAMRACGVSILQIVSPILLITFLLTLLCLYLQVEVGPPLLGKSRSLMSSAATQQPLALFEPGRPFNYKDGKETVVICTDDKIGDNELRRVTFCKTSSKGDVLQKIEAERGIVSANEETQELVFELYDCVGNLPGGYANVLKFTFNYGREANADEVSTRPKYMTLRALMGEIRRFKQLKQDTTELEVELNQRIAFALSPIAFLLLGMPLAIRTNRRETSIGIFISVILAGVFFLSIILCESFCKFPKIYPQYLLWLPNIIFQVVGAIMTYRISQR